MSQIARVSLSLALSAVVSHAAVAQAGAQAAMRAGGVDVGVGLGYGAGGGPRVTRGGVAASAVVAWRVPAVAPSALLGVVASAQAVLNFGTECVLRAPGTADGRCTPSYPGFQSLGVVAGWEGRPGAGGGAVRVLAGPAAFHSQERATALGVQGRADFATPSDARVAFLAWGQGALVPRLRGESYRMISGGIGLRVR
jgi:hypothetical protein